MSEIAPATLEGWYALHQMLRIDRAALRRLAIVERTRVLDEATSLLDGLATPQHGWSAAFQLVSGRADIMLVHFRDTLDAVRDVRTAISRAAISDFLHLEYDFLSVTEAGLYHATAQAAGEAAPGSAQFQSLIEEAAAAERGSAHVHARLFPTPPETMRYVSFYPMSKRRIGQDNWYALPIDERNRLMREHGLTGRRYAGRVFQVISGAVGLDDWEWGVTLFAADPLEFKRIVTEMRYDEASARYGEFGEFFTGMRASPELLGALL